jgi:hypothetical protein
MNIFPKLEPEVWITTSLNPDKDILHKPVTIQLKGGQKKQERFEIESINNKGQLLIRIDYNSSPIPGTVSFASYRVTQQDLDSWISDKEVVLKV